MKFGNRSNQNYLRIMAETKQANIESIDAFRDAPDGGMIIFHGREIGISRDMMEQIKRLITRKLWHRLKK